GPDVFWVKVAVSYYTFSWFQEYRGFRNITSWFQECNIIRGFRNITALWLVQFRGFRNKSSWFQEWIFVVSGINLRGFRNNFDFLSHFYRYLSFTYTASLFA
ncbi:MAG: hypothetical protein OEX19_05625, partial [Gammaproteobacteria bacterium]|nr:hypothetical protein [Gammaproteobacteria bacterium]